jgi:hypothetical protein
MSILSRRRAKRALVALAALTAPAATLLATDTASACVIAPGPQGLMSSVPTRDCDISMS